MPQRTAMMAVVLASAALLAIAWQLIFSKVIDVAGGCGFDGAVYCSMFAGAPGPEPYGRRILAPWMASHLSRDPLAGFTMLNTLAAVGLVIVVLAIAHYPGSDDDSFGPRLSALRPLGAAGLLAVAVVAGSRNLFRFVLSYPVITDLLSLFLLLVSILGILRMRQRPAFVAVAIMAAFLAPMARETTGFGTASAALVAIVLRYVTPAAGAGVLVAAAAGTMTAFAQVSTSSASGILTTVWFWMQQDFSSGFGLARFTTMMVIGLGFFWAPFVNRRFLIRLETPEWIILAAASGYLLVSVFGGGDTDRIVTPTGILLCLAACRVAHRHSEWRPLLAFLVAAYLVAQYPYTLVGSSANSWISFFALRVAPPMDFANNGLAPVLLSIPLAAMGLMIHSRQPRSVLASAPAEPGESCQEGETKRCDPPCHPGQPHPRLAEVEEDI